MGTVAPARRPAAIEISRRSLPDLRYSTIPTSYWDDLPSRLTPLAHSLVGQILRCTRWDREVRAGLPEWMLPIPAGLAAQYMVTVKAIEHALEEARTLKVIEARPCAEDRRQIEYRACVANFTLPAQRSYRTLNGKSAGTAAAPAAHCPHCGEELALGCPKCKSFTCSKNGEIRGTLVPLSPKAPERTKGEDAAKACTFSSEMLRTVLDDLYFPRLLPTPIDDRILAETWLALDGAPLEAIQRQLEHAKPKGWKLMPILAKAAAAWWKKVQEIEAEEQGRAERLEGTRRAFRAEAARALADPTTSAGYREAYLAAFPELAEP